MSNESVNYWKLATIGILLVGATVAATLMVAGPDSKTEESGTPSSTAQSGDIPGAEHEKKAVSTSPIEETPEERPRSVRAAQPNRSASAAVPPPPQAAYPPQPAYPSQSVMDACNRYANEQVNSKAQEVLTSAALGAAIGAAVGAAGGAIAGGGKGAGKGAAIGGVTGAAGGTLYGLNETKSHDAQYQAAYSSCMRSKGF
ncbi:hypothetical protein [Nitrosovibrio sp. Nv6]|uniref:hypothetical protein n=1 Tax=Nitrosovibrio sp. Nv6 TaxID=1855340 RepID=UPI0008C4EFEA|nr:hypothetical protein [Nitrosovibrio sp. Nv6]SEP39739.1 hypothetical protein SAMN05216316_2834 [Nitrosovibrio sp. Nv6]